jgi:Spy/CpxP family protein refolding chaperone
MKKNVTGIAVLVAGLMLAPAAWAQDAQPAPPGPPPGARPPMHERGPQNPEQQLRHMTRNLNLNSDQQAQFSTIIGERDSQVRVIRANTALSPRQMHEQMRSLMMDSDAKMREVLNPDQQQRFDAMRAQQREHREERHGRMGEGAAPPPPPQQ